MVDRSNLPKKKEIILFRLSLLILQARAIRISHALEDLTEKYIKVHSELVFLAKMVFF